MTRIFTGSKKALHNWAHKLKRNLLAVWLAARDARTPVTPKILALTVAGYALSPIDLIPDFIPVLGYLDDLILVPIGIACVIKLIPNALMKEFISQANVLCEKPVSFTAAIIIVLLWLVAAFIVFTVYF